MFVYISSPVQFKFFRSYFECLRSGFDFVFYLDETNHELSNENKWVEENNFQKLVLEEQPSQKQTISLAYRIYNKIFRKTFLSPAPLIYRSEKLITKKLTQFFVDHKPGLFLSFEDNYGMALNFVKAARQTQIPSAVIPFTLANQQELGYVYSKIEEFKINSFSKKVFYAVFSKWKTNFRGIKTSCSMPADIIARALLKLNPSNPWIGVGGNSDTVIFENEFVKNYYINSGLKNKAIKICPSPANTFIRKNEESVSSDKMKLLCSLPPDYYNNPHFSSYAQIVDFWIKKLASKNIQLTMSLHPRISQENFALIKSYDVQVSNLPIEQLMAECDVFVACTSAAIRIALIHKKTVLNFDMFDARYSEYDNITSVITVSTKNAFAEELDAICSGIYEQQIKDYYKDKNTYFGVISNTIPTQIQNTFLELCATH